MNEALKDDIFYVCTLVEYTARKTRNRRRNDIFTHPAPAKRTRGIFGRNAGGKERIQENIDAALAAKHGDTNVSGRMDAGKC